MNAFFELLTNAGLFAVILKTAPLLLAALGGAFTQQSGILNISLEGMMLFGAFTTITIGGLTGNAYAGILAAIIVCIATGLLFSWVTLWGRADFIVVGIGINLLAGGLTVFLLNQAYGASGSLTPGNITDLLRVDLGPLANVPVLGAFHGQTILVLLAFLAVPVCSWVMYRSRYGQHVRAIGEDEPASTASGLRPARTKTSTLVISGIACALAGSQLALATLESFNQGMTAGRGFIAVAALIFAGGRPWLILLIVVVFGFAQAYADQLQIQGAPSPIATMLPYLITVAALAIGALQHYTRRRSAMRRAHALPPVNPTHLQKTEHP